MLTAKRLLDRGIAGTCLDIFDVKYHNYGVGQLLVAPTANCQLNTWRGFNSLLNQGVKFEEFQPFYKTYMDDRVLLLIDIQSKWLEHATKFFGENRIILNTPYKSSNGNNMVILIANIE